ncbi:MAG: hypothetical protein JRH20_22275 [Deltaproteobacteria bacterium]|nr:hypothetical protein [Deltaproteobacteria bacterium]
MVRVRSDRYSFADMSGTLPIPQALSAQIAVNLKTYHRSKGEPRVVLIVVLERDTRVADLAVAINAAWRAGIDEGAFLVRKTLGYSILFEQKTASIRFPLTQELGERLQYGAGLPHDELSSPCGLLEVMRDEEIGLEAPFERVARAMVRCRRRFPHI